MSPSWRDRIEIFLGPDRVDATLVRRGLKPMRGPSHVQPCPATGNLADWRPAVEALAAALATLDWKRADARITLSNHYVRLALVPHMTAARDRAEREQLARHHLRATFGERADAWTIALSDVTDDGAVTAAIDPELVPAIRGALEAASIRVMAVEPFLVAAYNAVRATLPDGAAWLAVAERSRVCVAHLEGERWTMLRSQRVADPLIEALPAVLEQTRLAGGIESGGEVCLVTRDPTLEGIARAGDWTVRSAAPAGARRAAA